MNFIALGDISYAIKGGVQIEACEVLSSSDFAYADLPPSVKAQLRNTKDEKPIYQTSMFGKTFDTAGNILPSDDIVRVEPIYKLYNGTSLAILEILPDAAEAVLAVSSMAAVYMEQISLLKKYLNTSDITIETVNIIERKLVTVWSQVQTIRVFSGSLTQTRGATLLATGFPVPGSASYAYSDRLGFGILNVKLVAP
jgi:hypothetical protein